MDSEPMHQGARWRAAGGWLALQAAALVVLTGWLLVEELAGHTSDTGRGLGVAAVVLCAALGAGILTWALWAGRSLARTPTLLWHGILLLVGLSLTTSGAPVWGAPVIVVAVVGFVLGLRVPPAPHEE